MARTCEVCGKHRSTGNNVSHANNKTKRTWQAEPADGARQGRRRRETDPRLHALHPLGARAKGCLTSLRDRLDLDLRARRQRRHLHRRARRIRRRETRHRRSRSPRRSRRGRRGRPSSSRRRRDRARPPRARRSGSRSPARVSAAIPPSTSVPVAGSSAICPAQKTKPPASIAWLYGPTARRRRARVVDRTPHVRTRVTRMTPRTLPRFRITPFSSSRRPHHQLERVHAPCWSCRCVHLGACDVDAGRADRLGHRGEQAGLVDARRPRR